MLGTIQAARQSGDFDRVVAAVPYARFLGLRTRLGEDGLVTCLPFQEQNLGNPDLPALHGGVVAAFLELAATFELLWQMEDITIPRSVNLSVDYLRPARAADAFARGRVTRLGRRVANVQVEAWQDDPDRPIAQGHAHFLITAAGETAR